ncbi:dipeptide ABC transporter ATP-binding protein [Streptomyces sp. NPDC090052]|uniref:ABC transporter ATP-binding protein n=1 Tax=unclassified Streptomyces TaxID=2593676 RepID=UPI00225B6CCF|nr:ABC transporter ATP-binding protein [Streptomyces sp. NBC_01306]MCX4723885.1 ABC transporter ATP-binding protein [Streptomyces sp. NBC_01306]
MTSVSDTSVRDTAEPGTPVLEVSGLEVDFDGVPAVRGVSFSLRRGEVLGLVGESGSGKSATALAVLGLLPGNAAVRGSVRLDGTELVGATDRTLSAVRGSRIGMVFQDPLSAFTPVYRIGDQIAEAVRAHQDVSRDAARARAVELLDLVGIPEPALRARSYPHEFSGGMRQRAMIAMAMANDPDVILADEPTTALDVTIQAQVLDVLRTAQRETGAALVLVSHDLGVIAGAADRVAVMYAGRIVESASAEDLFERPRMPYTLGLIGAVPRLDTAGEVLVPIPGSPPTAGSTGPGCPFAPRCPLAGEPCLTEEPALRTVDGHAVACVRADEIAAKRLGPLDVFPVPDIPQARAAGEEDRSAGVCLGSGTAPGTEADAGAEADTGAATVLSVRGLVKTFPVLKGSAFKRRVGTVHAVDGVDLRISRGETLALVGESGSGKSTTLFELLNMVRPEGGEIELFGQSLGGLGASARRALRGQVQIVFQDPMASLDPRMTVGDIVAEPLRAQGTDRRTAAGRVPGLLGQVGLDPAHATRFPHEFSGGQRQRIGIARALSVGPKLLVLDEPVSALDVSVQAGVLNLLRRLKSELGLAYLFVSHDLSVVRHIADRVSVVYLGRTVESGTVDEVFERPRHPYTQALLSAVPLPDPVRERERQRTRILLPGDPPSPTHRYEGCRFRARCPVFAELGADERARCENEVPVDQEHAADHVAACHFPAVRAVV